MNKEKYHIKDDGMPGKCSAVSPESCPKTREGDSFHGTLEEAAQESQKRFENKLGTFVSATKAKKEAEANKKITNSEKLVYTHPQGKIIEVSNGEVKAFKNGVQVSTSATAERLAKGYGSWKLDEKSLNDQTNVLTDTQIKNIKDEYDKAVDNHKLALAKNAIKHKERAVYNRQYGEAEGRAYHYPPGGKKTMGNNPSINRRTFYEESPEQKAEREEYSDKVVKAFQDLENSQTKLEENGLGHTIPDEGNTIRVANQAQKHLLKEELLGQISDGHWENAANNPYEDWANAKVIVDPKNVGRNFNTKKDNYQLNAKALLDAVGDRMIDTVKDKTGDSSYDNKTMNQDLKNLRNIFKTKRDTIS